MFAETIRAADFSCILAAFPPLPTLGSRVFLGADSYRPNNSTKRERETWTREQEKRGSPPSAVGVAGSATYGSTSAVSARTAAQSSRSGWTVRNHLVRIKPSVPLPPPSVRNERKKKKKISFLLKLSGKKPQRGLHVWVRVARCPAHWNNDGIIVVAVEEEDHHRARCTL